MIWVAVWGGTPPPPPRPSSPRICHCSNSICGHQVDVLAQSWGYFDNTVCIMNYYVSISPLTQSSTFTFTKISDTKSFHRPHITLKHLSQYDYYFLNICIILSHDTAKGDVRWVIQKVSGSTPAQIGIGLLRFYVYNTLAFGLTSFVKKLV